MRKLTNKKILYSLNDLLIFNASKYSSWTERAIAEEYSLNHLKTDVKKADKPVTKWMKQSGIAFEKSRIGYFIQENNITDHIELTYNLHALVGTQYEEKVDEAFNATLKAMKEGKQLIIQAVLKNNDFMGIADLLVRVNKPSSLGNYSYEVKDIKRSHVSKAKFVLQICAYSDLLSTIQGTVPEFGEILLGNKTSEKFRIDEYFHYYLTTKKNFMDFQHNFSNETKPMPTQNDLKTEWKDLAKEDLHGKIESIANIQQDEIMALKENKIETIDHLLIATSADGLTDAVFHRLQRQAALTNPYEVLTQFKHEPGNLYDLDDLKENDVYLDVKLSETLDKDGLVFFYNILHKDEKGEFIHKTFECTSLEYEENCFKAFMYYLSNIVGTYDKLKEGKIYHFTPKIYDILHDVGSKYDKYLNVINFYFKEKRFVCLQEFLIQSVVINTNEYSLENISTILGFELDALGVGFESPLIALKANKKSAYDFQISEAVEKALVDLAADKVKFFHKIHSWLISLRNNNGILFIPHNEREENRIIEQTLEDRKSAKDLKKAMDSVTKKIDPIVSAAPAVSDFMSDLITEGPTPTESPKINLLKDAQYDEKEYVKLSPEGKVKVLIGQLMKFHEKEKIMKEMETQEIRSATKNKNIKNLRCLNDLSMVKIEEVMYRGMKSGIITYEYPKNEESKIKVGDKITIQKTIISGEVKNLSNSSISIRYTKKDIDQAKDLKKIAIYEDNMDFTKSTAEAIQPIFQYLSESKPYMNLNKALYDFFTKSYPDIIGLTKGQDLYNKDEDLTQAAIRVVSKMNKTTLIIQGPPGAGKSYTASQIVKTLYEKGATIGVSSNSHKAIDGLLFSIKKTCPDAVVLKNVSSSSEIDDDLDSVGVKKLSDVDTAGLSQYIIGSTAYGLTKHKLDYLFVDEAGQVSLANLLAMGMHATNIILIGDQMQLEQPIQAIHPGESGKSALDYFLGETKVIPLNRGFFLPISRRMNHELCHIVSKYFYNNELKSIEDVESPIATTIDLEGSFKNKGVQFIPVNHTNNTQYSNEEIVKVKEIVATLLTKNKNINGITSKITLDDIIIVSPYNLQVSKLKKELSGYKIGSVDLFQGQEAPIVIYSLAASDIGARGIGFLLNQNRTNVALSRGKCLALIVGSENILNIQVEKMDELKLLNMFSELVLLK